MEDGTRVWRERRRTALCAAAPFAALMSFRDAPPRTGVGTAAGTGAGAGAGASPLPPGGGAPTTQTAQQRDCVQRQAPPQNLQQNQQRAAAGAAAHQPQQQKKRHLGAFRTSSATAAGSPVHSSTTPAAMSPQCDGNAAAHRNAPEAPTKHADGIVPFAQFTAGALAGLVNVIVLSPLEVVKVRLQAQSRAMSPSAVALPPRYTGMVHALRLMLREEGWRSYYRGINASLWAFIPNWAIYWFSYEALKRRLTSPHTRTATPLTHVGAAMGAGALTAVATAPLWTLKSRLQTDIAIGARRRYTAVWSGLRKIVAEEGFLALYKGLTPTLLGLGHVMLQFPVYEHIKAELSNHREEDLQPAHILIASSLSKILASGVFYSHEVIRVRIQLDSRVSPGVSEPVRMARLARDILRTEGVRGLYRGFGTNLIRTVPSCMLTFTSYELAKRFVLENEHFLKAATGRPLRKGSE